MRRFALLLTPIACVMHVLGCSPSPLTVASGTLPASTQKSDNDAHRASDATIAPSVQIREYGGFAGGGPAIITQGPDGAMWFTTSISDRIVPNYVDRIANNGSITEFAIPGSLHDSNSPWGITTGPDRALWFADGGDGDIGRVTALGAFTEYPLPEQNSNPSGIVTGPDGALWFTEYGFDARSGNKIGRITTTGTITEYPIPTPNSWPQGITVGPDGALWFTETHASKIGRITTKGQITEYSDPRPFTQPSSIVAGLHNDLWFNEEGGDSWEAAIVRITTSGQMTEYLQTGQTRNIWGIALGNDGAVWFCEDQFPTQILSWIGRLGTDGKFQRFAIPTHGAFPIAIASGPNRTLWFTEFYGNNIGSLKY